MNRSKTEKLSHKFIITHHDITKSLVLLLDQSHLKTEVRTHCKVGLKMIEIIYTDLGYNTGKHFLFRREFDEFLKAFPLPFFDNRDLISVNLIAKNIVDCITANKIVNAC